jgi:hypothetical protein
MHSKENIHPLSGNKMTLQYRTTPPLSPLIPNESCTLYSPATLGAGTNKFPAKENNLKKRLMARLERIDVAYMMRGCQDQA